MRALGLVERRDYVLEERYADGHESQLPTLTAELLGTGVSIIVATSGGPGDATTSPGPSASVTLGHCDRVPCHLGSIHTFKVKAAGVWG
jgi:hypothetical protein